MAKQLLQPRDVMREELNGIASDWPMIEQAAGVPVGTIKKFVEDDDISEANLWKLDELNRQ